MITKLKFTLLTDQRVLGVLGKGFLTVSSGYKCEYFSVKCDGVINPGPFGSVQACLL